VGVKQLGGRDVMWRLLVLLTVLADAGCYRQSLHPSDQRDPPDAGFASIIHAADLRTARQLISGFHEAESVGRWTQRKFSVALRVPPLTEPAVVARIFIPEVEMARLHSITMRASVNEVALEPTTFTTAGHHVYVQKIPPEALRGDRARVDFEMDKWLPAGSVEPRELGVIATVVGLKNGLSPETW